MSYFATPYSIHFDDTMAYGSHHFLTGFKFQCAARESLLYGDLIFDREGVPESLDSIHLFTAEAYSRNLSPTFLGDRIAILITLEEWGRVSARFCYRVIGRDGQPICAGFQTMICSDAKSGSPMPLPEPLRQAFDELRDITEPESDEFFRDRVLAGTDATVRLFTDESKHAAISYLADRHPYPRLIASGLAGRSVKASNETEVSDTGLSAAASQRTVTDSLASAGAAIDLDEDDGTPEVWCFPGQGAFDADLLCERTTISKAIDAGLAAELQQCSQIAAELVGGDAQALFGESAHQCRLAVKETAGLSQVAIHLQSVLGARLRERYIQPAVLLGHSFGEIAALNVAGCFDLPTGVRIVCERVRAVEQHGPADGTLLAVASNRQVVAEEISVHRLANVVVAGRNHERQTIVSGPQHEIEFLRQRFVALEINAIRISSPTCFHHPLLKAAAAAWFHELRGFPISPPKHVVYSPIGRRVINDVDDIPTVLSSQFLRSFDLQGAIDDLVAGGFSRFVDCGSSGMFKRLLTAAGPDGIEVRESVRANLKSPADTAQPVASASFQPGHAVSNIAHPSKAAHTMGHASASAGPAESNSLPVSNKPVVAVVAQGCLLPGGATSPEELYAAISQGRSGIFDKRTLDEYWDQDFYSDELTADRSTSALVGLINDTDLVTPPGIDQKVFDSFSRAQKLFCVALAPCVDVLKSSQRVICLMGTTADGFQDQDDFAVLRYAGIDEHELDVDKRTGSSRSAHQDPYAAIKEVFDGIVCPDLDITLVDAACASSLYAVALGMQALENDEADVVLAGGVFCPGPGNNCLFSQFGGLTSTGCRPFDAGADGVVFSEGAAVVVLQREQDARREGRAISAVIRGAGLSSDGRSPSANVPQTAGQLFALERCYDNYKIDPKSVVAVEAHGTSTPVGDATELNTLSQFYVDHIESPLSIHSLKGLLGHTGWAAGTAALIAATEALRRREFPAQATHRDDSATLREAVGVLQVPTRPLPLTGERPRIAIDGFGFGGANGHLVVEATPEASDWESAGAKDVVVPVEELVVVGWHQLSPTEIDSVNGRLRFDRDAVRIPDGVLILPDLADDMDVTQSLALSLVGETLGSIVGFGDHLRPETGIILALSGKTERAVEATTRVLAPRLRRRLPDQDQVQRLDEAVEMARPSGPYTLQCMMPNVSAGRAALQFDLNGPNFVVDAGETSLESAIASASSLLRSGERSGSKVIVVAAIDANRWPISSLDQDESEFAVAFAVATRRDADEHGLKVLTTLEEIQKTIAGGGDSTAQKTNACVALLEGGRPVRSQVTSSVVSTIGRLEESSNDEFPIHTTTWVEAPLSPNASHIQPSKNESWLVLVSSEYELVSELISLLPSECADFRVAMVGSGAAEVARTINSANVFAVDMSDESHCEVAFDSMGEWMPDTVVAVDQLARSDVAQTLRDVSDNRLAELLFLVIKRFSDRVKLGDVDVFGLFAGGWSDGIHASTGAISGLLKSVQREMPAGRMRVLARSSRALRDALEGLRCERSLTDSADVDVVHDGTRRLVRRLRAISPASHDVAAKLPVELGSDSVVIASGGARGVTAIMVEALLRDHGCTVIALGRSPLEQGPNDFDSPDAEREFYTQFVASHPDVLPVEMRKSFESTRARWEANRTIGQLSAARGNVEYCSVDVTDVKAVTKFVQEVADKYGRVDLLMHGAGVQWSKKIEDRTLWEFRQTFAVKVGGLNHLVSACRDQFGVIVPAHILTSAYSIFGNDGQHDYGAANETMDRLCLTLSNSSPLWTSIAWSAWGGVGMTRGSEYKALADQRNLSLLDAAAGQRVFRAVLDGTTGAVTNVPLSDSERTEYVVRTIPKARTIWAKKGRVVEFPLRLSELPCLPYHRANGAMTLPGAWTVNLMAQAASSLLERPAKYFAVEQMKFVRFAKVAGEADPHFRVVVEATDDGFDAWLIGDVLSSSGDRLATDVLFATAMLSAEESIRSATSSLEIGNRNGNSQVRVVTDPYCARHENVNLSGPFDCLPSIEIHPNGRQAVFAPRSVGGWGGIVPSMLLDAALRVAGMHVVPGALHVPVSMDKVVMPNGISTDSFAAAGWQIRACRPVVLGDDVLCNCVEVTDQSGQLRLRVEGARVTRLR